MTQPFVGEIRMFGFNFPPNNWAFCNGQLVAIASNTALFSLLGTNYGGDGRTTFGLPDLRGRTAMGPGQGPGLTDRFLGEASGTETVTLLATEMPAHTHTATGSSTTGASRDPRGRTWAASTATRFGSPPSTAMSTSAISAVGGSQPHDNMPPYLAVNFCIATAGTFPARN